MARKRDSLVPINQQSEQPMLSRIGPVKEGTPNIVENIISCHYECTITFREVCKSSLAGRI